MKKINMSLFFLAMLLQAQNEVCLEIEPNPNADNDAFECFTKYVNVLDCFEVYAESSIPDYKVLHVAAVAAELLDNDEDGIVDDELLFYELQNRQALMPVFSYDGNACMDNFMDNYDGDGVSAVLWRNEIDPSQTGHWGDDATVEEVLHTINHVGHVSIYPNVFGLAPNSSIMSDAMDIARGGQFLEVPNNYPQESWYHYDDYTCDYECMAIEYLYWCIVTDMGILDDPQTCAGIANEWEPCSPELFESTDIIMHGVVNNSSNKLPQLAPDGNYCPADVLELTVTYSSDWNLIGLPLQVDGASYTILFPESIEGTLYSFDDGYSLETSLIQGEGYWLRFNEAGSTTITGVSISELTISLNEGWNLISGISTPFDISDIQDPDGIIISGTAYGFTSSGYSNTENIEPGKGYWIRANNSGNIELISE
jgi:hypothetical protein